MCVLLFSSCMALIFVCGHRIGAASYSIFTCHTGTNMGETDSRTPNIDEHFVCVCGAN